MSRGLPHVVRDLALFTRSSNDVELLSRCFFGATFFSNGRLNALKIESEDEHIDEDGWIVLELIDPRLPLILRDREGVGDVLFLVA